MERLAACSGGPGRPPASLAYIYEVKSPALTHQRVAEHTTAPAHMLRVCTTVLTIGGLECWSLPGWALAKLADYLLQYESLQYCCMGRFSESLG